MDFIYSLIYCENHIKKILIKVNLNNELLTNDCSSKNIQNQMIIIKVYVNFCHLNLFLYNLFYL